MHAELGVGLCITPARIVTAALSILWWETPLTALESPSIGLCLISVCAVPGGGAGLGVAPALLGVHHILHFLEEETEVQKGERLVPAPSVGDTAESSPGCQALQHALCFCPQRALPEAGTE